MKKSLLLSIVMTLVLVVAMSTATFAWYVAQSNVSASSTTVKAGSSTASSLAIDAVGVTDATATNTSVALTLSETVLPAAPLAAIEKNKPMPTLYGAPKNNANQFTDDGDAVVPAAITAVDGDTDSANDFFYVSNTHDQNSVNVQAKITFEGSTADNVVVAILVEGQYGDPAEATMLVKGVFSKTGSYDAGEIVEGATAVLDDATADSTYVDLGTIAANGSMKVSVLVWLDGDLLTADDITNNLVGKIAIDFKAA